MCCLNSSLNDIVKLIYKLETHNINFTIFREPDIGNEITAIAVEALPIKLHKKFFKNFKLGLS